MMKGALVLVSIAAAATSAGCGDAPTCDSAIRAAVKNVADGAEKPGEPAIVGLVATCKREGWKPALRTCLSKAKTSAALTACVPGPGPETKNGARRSEAEINLEAISKGAAIYYLGHGRYPTATGELTPSQPCCRPGGMTKCPSDPAAWDAVPVWGQLNSSSPTLTTSGTPSRATARRSSRARSATSTATPPRRPSSCAAPPPTAPSSPGRPAPTDSRSRGDQREGLRSLRAISSGRPS